MSVNSIQQIVRNTVLGQLTPYLDQFRMLKNQLDTHQQLSSATQSQIQSLNSEIQQLRHQNSTLKASLSALEQKYNQSVNYSIMKCQRKIEHLCDDIKNIQIKIENLPPNNYQKPITNNQLSQYRPQQNLRIVQQSPENHQLSFNLPQQNTQRHKATSLVRKSEKIFRYQLDNPHNQRFQIDVQLNKIKVSYAQQWDGHCYNFIKSGDIPYNQVAKFNLRQTKTVSRYVMTGIGTQKIFGMKDAHKSKECVAYFSANGNIWNQGVCTVGGRPINDGQMISVDVQRSRGMISWIVSNRILATSQLPAWFVQQQLYWIVLLVHENDTVQILLD